MIGKDGEVGDTKALKRVKELIIIDEVEPERLKIDDPDNGEKLCTSPPVDKTALFASIILPEDPDSFHKA